MENIFYDVIGIFGAFLLILGYFLLQHGTLTVDHYRYHLLNLAGASGILISLIVYWNLSQFLLEVITVAMSLVGMVITYFHKRKRRGIS